MGKARRPFGSKNYTKEDKKKFLKILEKTSGNISAAARRFGIMGGAVTVYKWRKKDADFAQGVDDIVSNALIRMRDNAFELAVKKKNANMIKFLLAHHPKAKELFNYSQKTEVSGPNGNPVSVNVNWGKIVETFGGQSQK